MIKGRRARNDRGSPTCDRPDRWGALRWFEVTDIVTTGLALLQLRLTLQLLAPAAMVQVGVRVPDIVGAAHVLPFQVVPVNQPALVSLVAISTALSYRLKLRPP